MPRAKQYDRAQALSRARDLFHAKGYEGTSLEDLVKAMGMNRFSIYAEFGGKDDLFQEAIRDYRERVVRHRFERLLASEAGLEAIRSYLRDLQGFLASDEGWKGCLVTNSTIDHGWTDQRVRRQAREHFAFMEDGFRQCLERARERGEIGRHKDPASLAKFLVLATQGLGVLTKVRPTSREWRQHIETILVVVEG